jgi:hypothetical protein
VQINVSNGQGRGAPCHTLSQPHMSFVSVMLNRSAAPRSRAPLSAIFFPRRLPTSKCEPWNVGLSDDSNSPVRYSTTLHTEATLKLHRQKKLKSNQCSKAIKILLELRQRGVVLPHALDLRSPIRFRHLSQKHQIRDVSSQRIVC